MEKNKKEITIKSSAAEYLTFVAAVGDKSSSVEMRYEEENIWLTQKMMAILYDVDVRTINERLQKIFKDGELLLESTIRNFRIVQQEGNRRVERDIVHYNLQVIIAVGFKVNSARAVQFRKWVNKIAKDYTIQGWAIDKDRLMNDDTILTKKYFEYLLEEIREIRISERRFYQKITDIYATAIDYDKDSNTTKKFYADVQNNLHWAIHGHTATELIKECANAKSENMGLTSWKNAPNGKIQKLDVSVAKNYLSKNEMEELGRFVSMYLDYAEDMAKRKIPMTMQDWNGRLIKFLEFYERGVLNDAGKVSKEIAKQFAESEFEKYRVAQDKFYESDFDKSIKDLEKLEAETEIKNE
ncbi:MAG: virulence RhuM family protein [Rickettsiales bacterium]|jgi:hypothetical protein|nr:virulence RhuM family protein [Rickettsiales bacterium]